MNKESEIQFISVTNCCLLWFDYLIFSRHFFQDIDEYKADMSQLNLETNLTRTIKWWIFMPVIT